MMKSILVSLVLVAVLSQQAAAQPCPSNICQASFNADDCCKWDYNKGKCQWRNTPVSFRLVRTCPDGSTVLTKGNNQGPASNDECKCNNAGSAVKPTTPAFSVQQICHAKQTCFNVNPRMNADISGHDISCQGQPGTQFCKLCGGLEAVKTGCALDRRCEAFTFESATGCGYLKSAPNTSKRMGWVAFTR